MHRSSPGFPVLSFPKGLVFSLLAGVSVALLLSPSRAGEAQTLTSPILTSPTLTPFEQLALTALFAGKPLTSLTLTGSATWIAGSLNESGTVSLTAGPDGSVSEAWTLPTQSHGVAETGFTSGKSCSYTDKAGNPHQNTAANCLQPVAWFAPWVALNLLSASNLLMATDVTQAADTAAGMVKLQFATQFPSAGDATTQAQLADISKRTAVSVSFNQISALPSSVSFDYVLDNDPRHAIEYTIVFADYHPEQGFMIPHRIQRYIQRTLQADITINSVSAS